MDNKTHLSASSNPRTVDKKKKKKQQKNTQLEAYAAEQEKYRNALNRYRALEKRRQFIYVGGFVAILLFMTHIKDMKYFITTEDYGNIINTNLSEIYYIPWKEACNYIREHKKDGDIILSTLPVLPYYFPKNELEHNTVYTFRQRLLEPLSKHFLQRTDTPTDDRPHAYTLTGVKNLYHKNPRGWLLAHYYFENVFTAESARDFCVKNMDYHFNQNKTGMIKIFSWDHSQPKHFQKEFFEELGKPSGGIYSETYNIDIPPNAFPSMKSLQISLAAQGINSPEEGIIEINNQGFYIPVTENIARSPNVEWISFSLDKQFFKEGRNEVRFMYKGNGDDESSTGFVIYSVQVVMKR